MSPRRRVSSGSPYEAKIGFARAVRVRERVTASGTAPVWPDGTDPDPAVQARWKVEMEAEAIVDA